MRATVAEPHGPKGNRRVVIALNPEISGCVVDEATTVARPVGRVRKVVAA